MGTANAASARLTELLHTLDTYDITGDARFAAVSTSSDSTARGTLEVARTVSDRLGTSARLAMVAQVESAEKTAREAERVSWALAAVLALGAIVIVGSIGARIEAVAALKRDFVSRVSHDLKTPLSSMQETVQALLDGVAGPLSGTQRRLLELNRESSHRLGSMLGKLLELSRLEALPQQARVEDVDVSVIARDTARRLAGPLNRVDVQAGEGAIIRGNIEEITQLLDNLVENALKFSAQTVTVAVSREPGAVRIHVADLGDGVPDGQKRRIFAPFQQGGELTGQRSDGVGLGLAICQQVVARHNGAIWVEDNWPSGSVFHVRLRM